MDRRAVTPVVEKVITMGIVVLFVGGMTVTLYGTAVPAYRDSVGTETAERVLAMASEQVERAVPLNASEVESTRAVELPATIRGAGYVVRVDGRSLVLDHPDLSTVDPSRLAVPSSVVRINGTWRSGTETTVTVRTVNGGLAIELGEGSP